MQDTTKTEDFYKQKIVWSDIATKPSFAKIEEGVFINNTCYMLTNFPDYLLDILNSEIIKWYFPKIATGLGNNGTRYFKQFVELLPIPRLEKMVDLYEYYGFSTEETAIIKSQ